MRIKRFVMATMLPTLMSLSTWAAVPPRTELTQLAEHLRTVSPNQLASLRWLSGNDALLAATQRHLKTQSTIPQAPSPLGVTQLNFTLPDNKTPVRLSVKGIAASGSFIKDGQRWKVVMRGKAGFTYRADELPSVGYGGAKQHVKTDAVVPPAAKRSQPTVSHTPPLPQALDEPLTADVVVAYSTSLVDIYGSEDAVLARIADVFSTANQAYADSGVPLNMQVVDAIAVDVDPDNSLPSSGVLDMVAGFTGETELFSHVRRQTERVGADFTVMFRPYANDGYCGIAYLSGSNDSEYVAGNMVSHTSLDCDDIVTAHELGHNMGLNHSRRQDGAGYVYPYALGYGEDGDFATIMAYPESFDTRTRITKFSSPNLDCNGSSCGISYEKADQGADAVHALNLRAQQIADVRQRQNVAGELVVINVLGAGQVRYGDQICAENQVCELEVEAGGSLALTAEAGDVATFEGWRGDCAQADSTQCDITANGTRNVIADFTTLFTTIDAGAAVGNETLTFETNAGAPWRETYEHANSGDSAVRAAELDGRGASILRTRVAEGGELSFAAKVSSERDYDKLLVKVNGEVVQELSGEQDWQAYSVPVINDGSDTFVIDFEYTKDDSVSAGNDTAWLDDIRFVPSGEPTVKKVTLNVVGAGYLSTTAGVCQGECSVETSGGVFNLTTVEPWQSEFVGWGGACAGALPECQIEVRDDVIIYAFFEQNFIVNASYNDALDNASLSFFTPERDWLVVEDAEADTDTVLTSPAVKPGEYTRVISYITGPGSLSFDYKIEANTDRAGMNLKIDGETILSDSGAMSWQQLVSLSVPEGRHEVVWEFVHEADVQADENRLRLDNISWTGDAPQFVNLSLSTAGGGGAIRADKQFMCRDDCDQVVLQGQIQTLIAEPDPETEFVRWEGVCSGNATVCELSMAGDRQATAVFAIPQYRVTASSSDGGIINPQRVEVNQGEVVTFNTTALEGYQQPSVSGCDVTRVKQGVYRSAPVLADCTVYADFEAIQHEVNFDLGWYGYRTGGGDLRQRVNWGDAAEAPIFEVEDGWHFAAWSDDFSRVKEDLEVEAIFQPMDGNHRVSIELGRGGRMNLQPLQYIAPGESVSVTLTPEAGQRVNRQVGGSCPSGEWQQNTYRFGPINADCSVTLGFGSVMASGSLLLILSSEAAKAQ